MQATANKVSYSFFIKKRQLDKVVESSQFDYLADKKLKVDVLPGGIVLPAVFHESENSTDGGVVANGHFYEHSVYHRGSGKDYRFNADQVSFRNEKVVYIGMWTDVWGHCITDNLKHLWFLKDENYSFLHNFKWVYTASDEIASPNFFRLLEKLGVRRENIERILSITQFKEVYLPDDSFIFTNGHRYYTKEFARLISGMLSQGSTNMTDSSCPPKIYFSRTGIPQKWQRDTGEKRIEKVFQRLGYTIFYPERLTFDRQLQLLFNCESFAATEGSISHNALFLKEGAELICIRKSDYLNTYQFAINQLKKLSVTLIDANETLKSITPWFGPFFLYNSRQLQRYTKSPFSFFPVLDYLRYLYRFEPAINRLKTNAKQAVLKFFSVFRRRQ